MGTAIDMAFGGATLAVCPLSALVLSFAFYGFCGWAWESTVCAMLNHGRFANSGFLLGPCCPIYGVGGIACWLLLRGIPDASSQFVAAALVCSVIEYSVGVLLEKTTGARFWDYSHLPFNLHGRICLYWACAFGLGALCICRLVEPALLGLLGHLPVLIVRLSAFIVAVAMMVDALCSLASWRRLSDQLERVRADLADRINESLADASDSMLERIPDSAIDSVAQTHIRGRAVNAWLVELGDAALDALREKASMPTFISDGARGLALAARRVADAAPSMPRPSLSRRLAGKGHKPSGAERVTQPPRPALLQCLPALAYQPLRGRHPSYRPPRPSPRAVPALAGTGALAASLLAYFPLVSRPLPRRFQDCGAVGGGKIWVEPAEEVIRIRTGEHGPAAV